MARKMKDSGVEWIGEIPENWDRTILLNILRCSIADGPHETPNLVNYGIPFISVDSLNDSEDIDLTVVKKYISEKDYNEYMRKTNLENGDILFSKAATIGKTAILKNEKIMVWSPLAIIKVNENMCFNKYLYHMLSCKLFIKYVSLLGGYNTQINVGMRALEKAFVPVPPKHQQQKIVNFLDEKVSQIDTIIAKTKESIEEYKKYKKAVVIKAVTKGLHSGVDMKKTDSDWIGKIPAHWDYVRIQRLFENIDERNEDSDAILLSLYTAIGVKPRRELEEKGNKAITVMNYKKVQENDIIVNRLLAWMGAIGYSDYEGVTSPDYDVYRAKEGANVVRNYYNEYFRNTCFNGDCYKYGHGIMLMRWRTYPEEFLRIKVPNPPLDEQQEIAEYLDEKCSEIDTLIAKKEMFIEEMQNYKKSLIYEYVTGKKEVL